MPTDHQHVLCTWHQADKETLLAAADAAVAARKDWEARPLSDRQSVYETAVAVHMRFYTLYLIVHTHNTLADT